MPVIPASSIPLAKQYLFDQIKAAVADQSDLGVYMDEPPTDPPPESDVIMVGNIEQAFEPWQIVGSGGEGWLYEKYSIVIQVSVYRGGDDPVGVLTRATGLVFQVCQVVRTDPSLGRLVLQAYPASVSYESGWSDEGASGRVTEAELKIAIEGPQ
jgi:hypothetical protein